MFVNTFALKRHFKMLIKINLVSTLAVYFAILYLNFIYNCKIFIQEKNRKSGHSNI